MLKPIHHSRRLLNLAFYLRGFFMDWAMALRAISSLVFRSSSVSLGAVLRTR